MSNGRDRTRTYTSLLLTGSFLILALSGIALYVAPRCRVAEATGWQFLLLSKDTWETVHIIFAFAVVFASLVHLYKNWKPLVSYCGNEKSGSRGPGKMLIVSMVVILVMAFLSAFRLPPLVWISDLHEKIKTSYSAPENTPGTFRNSDCPHRGQRCRHKDYR